MSVYTDTIADFGFGKVRGKRRKKHRGTKASSGQVGAEFGYGVGDGKVSKAKKSSSKLPGKKSKGR